MSFKFTQLWRRNFNQYRVLSDTFNHVPRNNILLLLAEERNTASRRNDHWQDPAVVGIYFIFTGVTEYFPRADIDHFFFSEFRRADSSHNQSFLSDKTCLIFKRKMIPSQKQICRKAAIVRVCISKRSKNYKNPLYRQSCECLQHTHFRISAEIKNSAASRIRKPPPERQGTYAV